MFFFESHNAKIPENKWSQMDACARVWYCEKTGILTLPSFAASNRFIKLQTGGVSASVWADVSVDIDVKDVEVPDL